MLTALLYDTIIPPHRASFSVVLPSYNPGTALLSTISDIDEVFTAANIDTCIIVVDDGSNPKITVPAHVALLRGPNQGKGAALRAGLAAALSPVVAFMDADGAYPASSLLPMYHVVSTHMVTAAVGSRRFGRGLRAVASRVFSLWVRVLHHLSFDTQAGIKVFSTEALRDVLPLASATGFAIDVDLLSLLRRQQHDTPALVAVTPRQTKSTTVSLSRATHAFFDVAVLRCTLSRRLHRDKITKTSHE